MRAFELPCGYCVLEFRMSFVPAASREEQTAPKMSLDSFLVVEVASCTHNDPAAAAAAAVESSPSRGCIEPSASRAMIESASKYPLLLIVSHCSTHRLEKRRSSQTVGNGLHRFEFVSRRCGHIASVGMLSPFSFIPLALCSSATYQMGALFRQE